MIRLNSLFLFVSLYIFSSCTQATPNVAVICEENKVGNCVIKWETSPVIQGTVKIYASPIPEINTQSRAIAAATIEDQKATIITTNPTQRLYYTLVFNEKYKKLVGSRNVNIPSVQNIRDLGGYVSPSQQKSVRWGKVFRSAEIGSLPACSMKELNNLGIRTVIDLRSFKEARLNPTSDKYFKVVHAPLLNRNLDSILHKVKIGEIRSDTIDRIIANCYRKLVLRNQAEIKKVFDVLLDEENYPVMIECISGKEQTGILSALLLSALEVSPLTILQDYTQGDYFYSISKASNYAYSQPVSVQEAITVMYSAKQEYIEAAESAIEKEYGSVMNYLTDGLGLTKTDIKTLRSILLE